MIITFNGHLFSSIQFEALTSQDSILSLSTSLLKRFAGPSRIQLPKQCVGLATSRTPCPYPASAYRPNFGRQRRQIWRFASVCGRVRLARDVLCNDSCLRRSSRPGCWVWRRLPSAPRWTSRSACPAIIWWASEPAPSKKAACGCDRRCCIAAGSCRRARSRSIWRRPTFAKTAPPSICRLLSAS